MRLFYDAGSWVEDPYFAHAIALARRGAGRTAPNPMVGCVIVRDGAIVGEGFHARAGEAHAEVNALLDAGEAARGADLYVTLEPCSHQGRTPPCVDAIIAAGVARVHVGMRDPTSEAGGGAEALKAAGVDVTVARDPSPFAIINEGWLKRLSTGMPFVTVKVAVTLDGRPALREGARAAITAADGASVTHRMRSQADAVLVGAATVAIDNPGLLIRDHTGTFSAWQPLRIVLAGGALPPARSNLFTDGAAPTLVLVSDRVSADAIRCLGEHVEIERYRQDEGLAGVLRRVGARGVNELLVEAGPRLLGALWTGRHADAVVCVTAGGMGGAEAPALFSGEADADGDALIHVFAPVETGIVGDVAVTHWRPREPRMTSE